VHVAELQSGAGKAGEAHLLSSFPSSARELVSERHILYVNVSLLDCGEVRDRRAVFAVANLPRV